MLMLSVLACACHRPVSYERFLRSDGSGMYEFEMDMSDSTCVYDLKFYTRLDDRDATGFPMQVRWYSPSGQLSSEQVYFDYASGPVAQYRLSCDPDEHGVWRMLVRADAPGMRGLGLVCAKRDRYGAR